MSKYIAVYEKLFPDDPIAMNDPRRHDIIGEMRAVHRAKTVEDATRAVNWWFWSDRDDMVRWVKRARKLMGVK